MGKLALYYTPIRYGSHRILLRRKLKDRGKDNWLDLARDSEGEDVDTVTPDVVAEMDFLSEEDRVLFIIALFIEILAKQVCHNYFNDFHGRFVAANKFPRWWGGRADSVASDFEPKRVADYVRETVVVKESLPDMRAIVLEALDNAGIGTEEVDRDEFWEKCVENFPDWLKRRARAEQIVREHSKALKRLS